MSDPDENNIFQDPSEETGSLEKSENNPGISEDTGVYTKGSHLIISDNNDDIASDKLCCDDRSDNKLAYSGAPADLVPLVTMDSGSEKRNPTNSDTLLTGTNQVPRNSLVRLPSTIDSFDDLASLDRKSIPDVAPSRSNVRDNDLSAQGDTRKHIVNISNLPLNASSRPNPSNVTNLYHTKSNILHLTANSSEDPKRVRLNNRASSSNTDQPYPEQTSSYEIRSFTNQNLTSSNSSNSSNCGDRLLSICSEDIEVNNLENIELDETSACLTECQNDREPLSVYDHYKGPSSQSEDCQSEETLWSTPKRQTFHLHPRRSFVKNILNRITRIRFFKTKPGQPYLRYEDSDYSDKTKKTDSNSRPKRYKYSGRSFRGNYQYSRTEISMAITKQLFSLFFHHSTLALFGAFLIHVTLGTVYTLSNVNSYMTSYIRKHGYPNATYDGAMWISAAYAVGQGASMVLGGYLEKRFSARLSCFLGCGIHSMSILSTSWSINHGPLAVLVTYGLLPGFGCGLSYMTPMSNGFAWFPNRRGLVAGVILAGFGIGTFVFNMAQTAFVNPKNLSLPEGKYFTQDVILERVPHLFTFLGSIYAIMQFTGCLLLFKPPINHDLDNRSIIGDSELGIGQAIKTKEFKVLFVVYGITTPGILFVNSILKEYGQNFIHNDIYLAWAGSMASIANSLGRLAWGLAIDKYSFTTCFSCITIMFGFGLFLTPFEFVLSSKLLFLLCTLTMFGSFSGWMSTYPVHLSRVFGRTNSGMIYGVIFISQAVGGIVTALGTHYLMVNYNRFVPFHFIVLLEILGFVIYHAFYPKH